MTVCAVITTVDDLREHHHGAFVPTMGALHEGHLSLIRRAAETDAPVIVSIFVNPTQFAPSEDLDRYPRTLEQDIRQARANGASVIFAPDVDVVYPPDEDVPVPDLPDVALAPDLEEKYRPGHFAGVLQVVARLFDLVQPRFAVFGEKDYQQLMTIHAMVDAERRRERWPDLNIIAHPTAREPDGLAMSSRNRFLDADERRRALGLSRALDDAQSADTPSSAEVMMRCTLEAHGLGIDYAVVRDARTLLPIEEFADTPARALIAARLSAVRLIDNAAVG